MNLLDELTIETGDYAFRKNTNALRKWKYDMFLLNQEYKQLLFRRGNFKTFQLNLTGRNYKKKYIPKLNQLKEKYLLPNIDIIKEMIFELNDGKDFAVEVLQTYYNNTEVRSTEVRSGENEKQWRTMTDEEKTCMINEFLQIVNAVIISLKPTTNTNIRIYPISQYQFWDELKRWYIYDGKFLNYNNVRNEPPDLTETNEFFKDFYKNRNKFLSMYEKRNLTTITKLVLQKTNGTKTAFFSVPKRIIRSSMNYLRSSTSFYDITNAKKFNTKGQASSKGLISTHLYTYITNDKKIKTTRDRWTFGGITAGHMEHFVIQNGYIGEKMNYKECINWILKEMDFQDFTNRTPPKIKVPKSKKGK